MKDIAYASSYKFGHHFQRFSLEEGLAKYLPDAGALMS